MNETIACDHYGVLLSALGAELKRLNPRRALIHAPDGLKHLYTCVEDSLRRRLALEEVYFSSSPGYGACDIPLEEAIAVKADVVIHLGHEKYVYLEPASRQDVINVVYMPVFYQRLISEHVLEGLYELLKDIGAKSITLSYTSLEVLIKKQIFEYLAKRGIVVRDAGKPVLGCFYNHVLALENAVDAHVVVAGGMFHALGLGLIASKPVVALDPYVDKLWIASHEANKLLRKRLYAIMKAKESPGNRVGLIVGARPGQYRPAIVSYIEKLADIKGYKVYKVSSNYLTLERLYAIDSGLGADFYVVTSCPRLPIDDLSEFHKPVLTPGEFIMLVTGTEKYIYPW